MAACSRPDDRSQVQQYLASCTSDGALGVGIYQEGGGGLEEINADANVGVDVTTAVAGPLQRRLDYHAPRLAPGRTATAALRRAQQVV